MPTACLVSREPSGQRPGPGGLARRRSLRSQAFGLAALLGGSIRGRSEVGGVLWLIIVVVVVVLLVLSGIFVQRRRRAGGVIATRRKK
jgi:hypothetical protein